MCCYLLPGEVAELFDASSDCFTARSHGGCVLPAGCGSGLGGSATAGQVREETAVAVSVRFRGQALVVQASAACG